MAPGTTIGSVAPVEVGPGGIVPVTDLRIINAVVNATREELALHGRNVSLAERFVVDIWNLNASQAQTSDATELIAASPTDFAKLANGRRVVVKTDTVEYKNFTLATAGAEIDTFSASTRVRLLEVLSDPLVASLLLILGIYLVIFGISAPGHGAEIAGIIILLLALIGLGFSVDPIALLLFIVGVILIIIEIKTPGFSVFGIGGIIAIVLAAARTTLGGRCRQPLGCRLWTRPRGSRPPSPARAPRGAARSPSPRGGGPRPRSRVAQSSSQQSERGAGFAAP